MSMQQKTAVRVGALPGLRFSLTDLLVAHAGAVGRALRARVALKVARQGMAESGICKEG